MDLVNSLHIAGSGMFAQGSRMKVIAQNIANVDSTSDVPGGAPYRRKVIAFKDKLDRELGIEKVDVYRIGEDDSDFEMKFDPSHPAANEEGYVLLPNVNVMIEMMDMREAQRSYEANINVVDVTKKMLFSTLGILRG